MALFYMNKKRFLRITIIIAIVIVTVFILRGSEDRWICNKESGEWAKHGVPSAPMPTEPCGETKVD